MAIFGICKMILITCLLIIIICLNIYLYYHFPDPPKIDYTRSYDTALVLGCPCHQDGSLSSFQKERMDCAIRLYQLHIVKTILISGSNVQNKYYEAETMAAYARQQQIPKDAIIIEKQARNTYENLKYAKMIYDEKNMHSIVVITSLFHVRRAYFFVRKFFDGAYMDSFATHVTWKQKLDEYYRLWNTLYYEHKLKNKKNIE